MASTRIKDLPDITPAEDTYVPGDSVATGTGKATALAWVSVALKSALAALSGAVAAAGTWTFDSAVTMPDGSACSGDFTVRGLNAALGADMGAHRVTSVLDPVSAQDADTKNARDVAIAAAIGASDCAAAFSDTGTKLFSTSALFTGNATVSDTSLYTIPFAGASGSFCPIPVPLTGNPNFATVTLTGAPASFDVRIWKHDGTKEARDFIVFVRRGAA